MAAQPPPPALPAPMQQSHDSAVNREMMSTVYQAAMPPMAAFGQPPLPTAVHQAASMYPSQDAVDREMAATLYQAAMPPMAAFRAPPLTSLQVIQQPAVVAPPPPPHVAHPTPQQQQMEYEFTGTRPGMVPAVPQPAYQQGVVLQPVHQQGVVPQPVHQQVAVCQPVSSYRLSSYRPRDLPCCAFSAFSTKRSSS